MWMDVYVSEILVRQQLRDAQESAARCFALANGMRAPQTEQRSHRLTRLLRLVAHLHPRQLIAGGAER